MIATLFTSLLISLISTIVLCSSPTILGLWIMLTALVIAATLGGTTTSWLGLIVFLIYIGGLLVMFAYFVALTPNILMESFSWVLLLLSITFILSSLILFSLTIFSTKIISCSRNTPIIFLLSSNTFAVVTLALVLFIALVSVVKICSQYSAPLRPFN